MSVTAEQFFGHTLSSVWASHCVMQSAESSNFCKQPDFWQATLEMPLPTLLWYIHGSRHLAISVLQLGSHIESFRTHGAWLSFNTVSLLSEGAVPFDTLSLHTPLSQIPFTPQRVSFSSMCSHVKFVVKLQKSDVHELLSSQLAGHLGQSDRFVTINPSGQAYVCFRIEACWICCVPGA